MFVFSLTSQHNDIDLKKKKKSKKMSYNWNLYKSFGHKM